MASATVSNARKTVKFILTRSAIEEAATTRALVKRQQGRSHQMTVLTELVWHPSFKIDLMESATVVSEASIASEKCRDQLKPRTAVLSVLQTIRHATQNSLVSRMDRTL